MLEGCLSSRSPEPRSADRRTVSPGVKRLHLVCMPFQVTGLSSLSTVLLATFLRQHEVEVEEHYLHFGFAELLGAEAYREIAESASRSQVGELLFAEALHGRIESSQDAAELEEVFGPAVARSTLLGRFLELCREHLGDIGDDLVGLTTSSHQLLPSLWLARHLKAWWPEARTVFGGAACSEPMGQVIFEAYPDEIDVLVNGYGERPLLELARGEVEKVRAFLTDHHPVDLDGLPVPDYDRFLEQAGPAVPRPGGMMLAFETSRGCWWGEKSHCAFCGLNQLELPFNSKTSKRSLDEIRTLWDRYGFNLFATDTILARSHVKEVLPALAGFDDQPSIFYEVKSNMRRAEIQTLKAANVQWVQPGIESLSTPLLKLLRKGVTAIQNLAFLKACREERVLVSWNLLCAIPGEHLEHYEEQLELIEKIPHFCPAQGASPIRIDRYSPYFEEYRELGWTELRPFAVYRSLHPHLSSAELADVAYHFEGVGGDFALDVYYPRLEAALADWQRRYSAGDGLFWDSRHGLVRVAEGTARAYERLEILETVLEATHEVTSLDRVRHLSGVDDAFLDELVREGILVREGRRLLNLAVRLPEEIFASRGTGEPRRA